MPYDKPIFTEQEHKAKLKAAYELHKTVPRFHAIGEEQWEIIKYDHSLRSYYTHVTIKNNDYYLRKSDKMRFKIIAEAVIE